MKTKNKKKIIALWIMTFIIIIASIPTLFYHGYSVGAIVLIVLGLSGLHFFLLHVLDNDWNQYDFINERCAVKGEMPNFMITDDLECFESIPKPKGIKNALQEEKINSALRVKYQKVMLQQHGHTMHYPARYRHAGSSAGYFMFAEFGIKLADKNAMQFYKTLERLQCSTYAIRMFYKATHRLPSPKEDEAIVRVGFDEWYLSNFIRLLGGANEREIYNMAEWLNPVNKNINKYRRYGK